jgi:hypothetical protein
MQINILSNLNNNLMGMNYCKKVKINRNYIHLLGLNLLLFALIQMQLNGQIPSDYKGKPFSDDTLGFKGPQVIPGRIELAYYDFGGEGVAYHDSTASNDGAKLNHQCFG